jgi:hypothetical protein
MLHAKVGPGDREQIGAELKTATDAKGYRWLQVIDLSGQVYQSHAFVNVHWPSLCIQKGRFCNLTKVRFRDASISTSSARHKAPRC